MLKSIWKRIRSFRYIFVPLFLMQPATEHYEIITHVKSLNPIIRTTRTNFGSTKYPREKKIQPRKCSRRHDGTMVLDTQDPRWHTRPTMTREPWNLVGHSLKCLRKCYESRLTNIIALHAAFISPGLELLGFEKNLTINQPLTGNGLTINFHHKSSHGVCDTVIINWITTKFNCQQKLVFKKGA